MNVAAYVRVSTQEQKLHGISVDAQEAACRAWVQEHGHHLVGVYNDAGLSARAKYTKRTAMLRLIEDIKAGKIELVIFTKLDRWFRNVADYYEVQSILEAHNVKWRAVQEDYETETASGRFKVNIMLAVAQDEADRTSERIAAMHVYKKSKGEYCGPAPVGYKVVDKLPAFDEETFPAVRAFFDTYFATTSTSKAIDAAADLGLKLNRSRACRMLSNPTYAGDAFGIACPAYITKEQYDSRQAFAMTKTRYREAKDRRVYLFSGLLRCGTCGGNMVSSASRETKSGTRFKYYKCSNRSEKHGACNCPGYIGEKRLESFLIENLETITAAYNTEVSAKKKVPDKSKTLQRENAKLDRLKELYIDGDISRDVYDKRSAGIKEKISELSKAEEDPKLIELPRNWTAVYTSLSDDGKKAFWRTTIKKVLITKGKEPKVFF